MQPKKACTWGMAAQCGSCCMCTVRPSDAAFSRHDDTHHNFPRAMAMLAGPRPCNAATTIHSAQTRGRNCTQRRTTPPRGKTCDTSNESGRQCRRQRDWCCLSLAGVVVSAAVTGVLGVGSTTSIENTALITLYNTTMGWAWRNNSGWSTDSDACSDDWLGVTCVDGSPSHVTYALRSLATLSMIVHLYASAASV